MRDSEKTSNYQRSKHRTRSKSRDKERTKERSRDRERTRERSRDRERTRERSRDRERYRDRDRERERSSREKERDRDYYSSRHYKSKPKKSKHSKKSRHRRRSSSESSTSSVSSRDSRSSRNSKYSSTPAGNIRAPSSESNSRSAVMCSSTNNTASLTKAIDLMDFKVQKALETIEEDTFVPRAFFSTRDREAPEKNTKASDKVIIDLQAETVTFCMSLDKLKDVNTKEELFHPNFLGDAEQKQDRWVRKLFLYRQKYMTE